MSMSICRRPRGSTKVAKKCHCPPNKAQDFDVIDLPYDRDVCEGQEEHPLVADYEEAAAQDLIGALPRAPSTPSQSAKHVHVAPKSYVNQLIADVQMEKQTRRERGFPNYLSWLGRTGSYCWPSQYLLSNLPKMERGNFYGTIKQHQIHSTYDDIFNPALPNNAYKYMYNLHREDRRHSKKTGLEINAEEMSRPKPGVLCNSDYGRRHDKAYPDERYHHVYTHKSFYRTRGEDGAR